MILNASSTTIDTTWVTPTLTTTWMSVLPPPCLNNRTRSPNLKDFCGNHSANIICDVDNSTCMVSSDGDWRCQCMKGFYQLGHMCERVYTIPTRINSSSTTCSVSNSDFFYCINVESSVDVYIRHSIALTDMTDAYKVSVFGSTNVESNVVFGQLNLIVNVIKPVPVLPVLVSDRVIRGQIILHLQIASNILFSLNDTRFEVRVEVRDINDNGPSLPADLRRIVALPEDTPTGSVILNVTATDPDAGNNAITRFSLTAEQGSPAYAANSLLTSAANITIEILDVNDNIPRFVGSTSTLQIPEGATAAEQFQWVVSVTDADKKNSANGDVFVGVTNLESCPFNVIARNIKDNDKSLSFSPGNNTELDFETKKEFDCQLIARDKGTPALESNFSMVITLTDVNDNAPYVIDGPYVFNVSRYIPTDHVIVQKINASDMDVGQNAQLTFSKANVNSNPRVWDYFSVSQSDGRIRVYRGLKSLDFDEVVLNVNISDRGSPVNFTVYPITIYLEDDNQRPYFDKLQVSINVTIVEETRYQGRQSVFENIPGFPLRAKDDQKSVTVICNCTYYLQNNYGLFEVDQSTADIYLKVNQFVDREVNSSISIELFGLDNGLPRQRTIPPMVININIDDINDNAPEFTQTNYQALIFQDHPINAEVVTVSAVDNDLDDNALTQYSIVSVVPSAGVAGHFNQSTFSLHENNGTIYLSSSVHLDTTETAIDVNKPTFTDTARVTVTVRYNDPNKHAPRFAQDVYSHRLMLEKVSPGDSVLTITATDADPDTTIMYSIIQGNIRDTFEIQHDDGDSMNITLKYPVDQFVIDRLQDPRTFTLVIVAVDNGVIPKTGTTTVVMRLEDDPQKCDLGFQKQTLKTTTLSTPAGDLGFESAMYVMVGVVSVLLISNTIFILKYCRARSLPLRRNGFYPTGHSKKPSSKRHDGEFHKIKENYGHFITPDYDWTANVAYKTNRDLSRGFPPPLPPRRGGLYPPVVY
ncbi:hypothetical protein FSP39_010704 [Pinctada imbricata]|uniref:Cadherin domain-containing protein n=1 Tax=Pinctada imbricata TaxID=66713 RepID=A0AA88YUQ5_PINIB|nr:hypothetical protein FSP39_010704 [Pinctada imbricata]